MIAYVVDLLLILAAFALQIRLPMRFTAVAAAVIAASLVIQLTVGHDNDHYFFVFVIMMLTVLALMARGIHGQLRRRSATTQSLNAPRRQLH